MKALSFLIVIALASSCMAMDNGPGGNMYISAVNGSAAQTATVDLKTVKLNADWTFTLVANGSVNAGGIAYSSGTTLSTLESIATMGVSPEVLNRNPSGGYADLLMTGYWAAGAFPGYDRPAAQTTNYPTAGYLKVTPADGSLGAFVLGNGYKYSAANYKSTDGNVSLVDETGGFTGHVKGIVGDAANNGYYTLTKIWDNPINGNITDASDITCTRINTVEAANYNGDFELRDTTLYQSYANYSTRKIMKFSNSFAPTTFFSTTSTSTNQLYDVKGGNTVFACFGIAAGTITGSDLVTRDAVWCITNDNQSAAKQRITLLTDLDGNGDAMGTGESTIIYDATSSNVLGDDPTAKWTDMELITNSAGTKFLMVEDPTNNKMVVLQLNADGTFAGGDANVKVLSLNTGDLSGTTYSFKAMEFDPAPEPATLTLLAAAGCLLRRKK